MSDKLAEARNYQALAESKLQLSERRRDSLRSLLKEAMEALEPFAEEADAFIPDAGDDRFAAWAHDFTIGSLRRARSIHAKIAEAVEP